MCFVLVFILFQFSVTCFLQPRSASAVYCNKGTIIGLIVGMIVGMILMGVVWSVIASNTNHTESVDGNSAVQSKNAVCAFIDHSRYFL